MLKCFVVCNLATSVNASMLSHRWGQFTSRFTLFTRYNWLSNPVWRPVEQTNRVVQPAVYTIQPFVKPVECLYTRYNRLSNRFDNRLYRVNGALESLVCLFCDHPFDLWPLVLWSVSSRDAPIIGQNQKQNLRLFVSMSERNWTYTYSTMT